MMFNYLLHSQIYSGVILIAHSLKWKTATVKLCLFFNISRILIKLQAAKDMMDINKIKLISSLVNLALASAKFHAGVVFYR